MTADRTRSFAEFWPFYLREHSDPRCRAWHYAGTLSLPFLALAAVTTGHWGFVLALPVAGYGGAWIGHFGFQRNRPATFQYPLWSLMGDFRMVALFLLGRLGPHLDAAVHAPVPRTLPTP